MTVFPDELHKSFQNALECKVCFESSQHALTRPLVDKAQPRWIGSGYWKASLKIALVLTNPGAGRGYGDQENQRLRDLLNKYSKDRSFLTDVFEHQRQDMLNWGKGTFRRFYISEMQFDFTKIATVNIAWCATQGDKSPKSMLSECYRRHTSALLKFLKPDVIILGGGRALEFFNKIASDVPGARIICTPHYAARISNDEKHEAARSVREVIDSAFYESY